MPFTAEAKNGSDTWELVDITTHEMPKIDFLEYALRCPDPDCHAPMIVKHGSFKVAHFAHAAGSETARCVFAGEPESEEHRAGKKFVAAHLARRPEYKGAVIEFERIVNVGDRKRIVDVCVRMPNGSTEAHEIQLARTSVQECKERTNDYHSAGIDDVWWWFSGKNAADPELSAWATLENGVVGNLSFESKTERIEG